MELLTSKKNATVEPTAYTVGSWHAEYRCAMRKDASSGGTGRTRILETGRMQKRTSDAFLDNFCNCRTKSDAGWRESYMTLPVRTSSPWRRCLVNSALQFLRLSENHVGCFPSAAPWRTSASAMSAHFLTSCTHRSWMTRV